MNSAPTISVIIPTYNRQSTLLRAVESVVKQDYKYFDLWIVDDGSTDQTEDLIKKYIRELKLKVKIYYIKTKNHGVSAARNLGVEKSEGEWIAFLDSDDEWLPGKLTKQMDFVKSYPQISLVHGEEIWIRNGVRVNQKKIHQKFGGKIFQKCLPLCLISPSACLIRKELFLAMGGFDESFTVCEDYDLWLKITSLFEVGFIPDPIIKKYGGHIDQLSRKYVAMDHWRLQALGRILDIRKLDKSDTQAVKSQLEIKGRILLKGYLKHGNLVKFQQIRDFIRIYIPEFHNLN